MKKACYAVTCEGYALEERINVRTKHGRTRKQHYLSKQARRAIDKGKVDGVNLKDINNS